MAVNPDEGAGRRVPAVFLEPGSSSFIDFLGRHAPGLLPTAANLPAGGAAEIVHATTIVTMTFDGGVLMAGDRRATAGNVIAHRRIEKVFPADEYSCIAFAGAAGMGVEMVRLFQLELEHYEKIEGTTLSLEGKANRLSAILRSNLGMAMQGFAAIPLFAGHEPETGANRIYSYDVSGNRQEELEYHTIGSGSPYARGSLKKLFRPGMSEGDAVTAAVQALYDAADDDSATAGPDLTRDIYPTVAIVSSDGFRMLTVEETSAVARRVVDERGRQPNGPTAPLG